MQVLVIARVVEGKSPEQVLPLLTSSPAKSKIMAGDSNLTIGASCFFESAYFSKFPYQSRGQTLHRLKIPRAPWYSYSIVQGLCLIYSKQHFHLYPLYNHSVDIYEF